MVFDAYAAYYDILYTDKDYREEARYVHKIIQRYYRNASTILDLGCGTGKHAKEFFDLGNEVSGVDKSAKMISIAEQQFASDNVKFHVGDIRTFRTNIKYEAVVSLFHVMSYLTNDVDLEQAFETASVHLNKNGLFIFDCWYGPGVLDDPPIVSTKKMSNDNIEVERTARPKIFSDKNIINVEFQVSVKQKENEKIHSFNEAHAMRYLFVNELKSFALKNNFHLQAAHKWMDDKDIGNQKCWNAVFVFQKL